MELGEYGKLLIKVEKEDIIDGFLAIPRFVERIGDFAFEGRSELIEVEIPNTVKVIGKRAFYRCIHLRKINIPDSVTIIHESAFAYCCETRDSVIIPDSVTYIGRYAFASCFHTLKFYLPDSLNEISPGMFYDCKDMKYVRMPSSLERIKEYAFDDCKSLQELVVPDSVIEFDEDVFTGCNAPRKLFVRSELALGKSFMHQFSDTNVEICLSDDNENAMRLLQDEYPQLKITVGEIPTNVEYLHRIIENPEVIIYVDELSKAMEDIIQIKDDYDSAVVVSCGEKEVNFNQLRNEIRGMFNYVDVVTSDIDLNDVAKIDKDFDLFVLTEPAEDSMKNIDTLRRAKKKYFLKDKSYGRKGDLVAINRFIYALQYGDWSYYSDWTPNNKPAGSNNSCLDTLFKEAMQNDVLGF